MWSSLCVYTVVVLVIVVLVVLVHIFDGVVLFVSVVAIVFVLYDMVSQHNILSFGNRTTCL